LRPRGGSELNEDARQSPDKAWPALIVEFHVGRGRGTCAPRQKSSSLKASRSSQLNSRRPSKRPSRSQHLFGRAHGPSLHDAWTAAEQLRSASQIIRSICRAAEIECEISPIRPAHALPFAPGPNERACPAAPTVRSPPTQGADGASAELAVSSYCHPVPMRAPSPTLSLQGLRRGRGHVCGERAAARAKEKILKSVQRQGSDLAYQPGRLRCGTSGVGSSCFGCSTCCKRPFWTLVEPRDHVCSGDALFWADLVSRRSRSSRVAGEHEKDAAAGRDGEPGFRRRRYPGFRSASVRTGDGAVHDSPKF
jgi:hypothetical protein